MSRGPTAPVEQQDIDVLARTLDAILKELRDIKLRLMPGHLRVPPPEGEP